MNEHLGWYLASDGYWYYGAHPQPYVAPPLRNAHGGWSAPVAAMPPPPPAGPAYAAAARPAWSPPAPAAPRTDGGWVSRHKTASSLGAAVGALLLVGALAGDGTDTAPRRPVADAETLHAVETTAPPATSPPSSPPVAPPATRKATPSPTRPRVTRAPAPVKPSPAAKPSPTTKPKPPPAPTCGAPANPWGFNFCGRGSVIYDPPTAFCGHFDCIESFWESTNGYVMQCDDGMYSHSGGRRGSCSHHGGNNRPLYG